MPPERTIRAGLRVGRSGLPVVTTMMPATPGKTQTPRAAQPRCASLVLETLGKVERVQQVVGSGIAGSQGRKAPSRFDQFENRGRFVVRVIDKPPLCERRDDDGRHAQPGSPAVHLWWRYVVPTAARFVVRNDDHAVFPNRALLHPLHEPGDILLPFQQGRISQMLVFRADRLDERNGRQRPGAQSSDEIFGVLQMLIASRGAL